MYLKNLSIFLLILTICFSSCLSVEEPNIIIPNFVENPEAIAEIVLKHPNLLVITDEIFSQVIYDHFI